MKEWTKSIISGLLGTVILSLLYQCVDVAHSYGGSGVLIIIELAAIYGLNIFLAKKYDLGTWVNVIISIGAALILGNLII